MARIGFGVAARRSWRGLRARPPAVQALALAAALAVVVAAVVGTIAVLPEGGDETTTAATGLKPGEVEAVTAGVTDDSITVVFPVIDVAAVSRATGLAGVSQENSRDAVRTYVKDINAGGGINGRRIEARVEKFNPLDPADMRAKCKDWTTDDGVFAVVDQAAWYDDHQLCITQEGRVPLISSWTTVTEWTERGAPFLWWAGPDQAEVLRNLVPWALEKGLLGPGTNFAVVAGDRAGDRLGVEEHLLPALRAAGLEPGRVEELSASLTGTATTQTQARAAVERLKGDGIEVVIPLLPVNALRTFLAAADQDEYYPQLLLSDYEQAILVGLGMAEFLFEPGLGEQMGTSVLTLSSEDNDIPGTGYYGPGPLSCFETWERSHEVPPYIEAQGPIMNWCQNIRLFAEGARRAGRGLNRRTFVEAMATITDFEGALTPTLSYGTGDYAGPTQYRTVRIHKNDPGDNQCPLKPDGGVHGSCWILVDDYRPLQGAP